MVVLVVKLLNFALAAPIFFLFIVLGILTVRMIFCEGIFNQAHFMTVNTVSFIISLYTIEHLRRQ